MTHASKPRIYLIQDDDAPVYVLAHSYQHAIEKWQRWIVADRDGSETMLDPPQPQGIQMIADGDEVIQ